ncbi:MAG: DegT/DnrJ/EryC1/StrS family aminotransferase [Solirubrobacterales bacterium]|nr:DegT/DnrJ/EryC1/StrS family aminotransferase [Solirubrobacterales bacterium]
MPPINLYSDTQTRPTDGMRAAIASAVVGDEQRGLDPTTRRLEERVAELLGFETAVLLPSGTMCNEIAMRLHARPGGDEVIMDRTAHPVNSEAGGPAVVSGLMVRVLDGDRGVFTGADLEAAVRPTGNRYTPRSRLVCVEQTSNLGGGRVWPASVVHDVLDVAARFGLRTHLDGARLMNAVVATGMPASSFASGFDTAWIDFTKGLGAPVGAVLAGSRELIDEAWRWKQMLGGAFRQSGMVAAGCLYALDHHVSRLAEDHLHARVLAEGLAALPGVRLDVSTVETNIVIFSVDDAPGLVARLADRVELQAFDAHRVRAVTHLDVSRADVESAVAAIADELG